MCECREEVCMRVCVMVITVSCLPAPHKFPLPNPSCDVPQGQLMAPAEQDGVPAAVSSSVSQHLSAPLCLPPLSFTSCGQGHVVGPSGGHRPLAGPRGRLSRLRGQASLRQPYPGTSRPPESESASGITPGSLPSPPPAQPSRPSGDSHICSARQEGIWVKTV